MEDATYSEPSRKIKDDEAPIASFTYGDRGFIIGMIAGLLGVGGGFLFMPMMLVIGYHTKRAAATSSFVVIFSSFSGFAGHIAKGHFNWPLMLSTVVAVIIGSQIGAKIMKEKMKAKWIKQMFAVVLLVVAFKLLIELDIPCSLATG